MRVPYLDRLPFAARLGHAHGLPIVGRFDAVAADGETAGAGWVLIGDA